MLRKILIPLSYILMVIGVLVTTVVLVAIGQGYSFNFKTHQFKNSTGLLAVNSTPQGASIYLNGRDIKRKTPYRTTVEAGDYDIEVRKDNFATWHKHVTVKPSGVTSAEYIVMIPTDLSPNTLSTSQAVSQIVASRDRKHFAYIATLPAAEVWLVSSDRRSTSRLYIPRAATADQPAETLTGATWSDDGSHLLIRTSIGSVAHYLVIASGGGAPTDLTDLFKFDLTGLQFSPNDWRDMYWTSPEGLRHLNIEAQTVSAVLAAQVSSFTFAGDRLIYIQSTPNGKTVWSTDRNGHDPKRLVDSLSETETYELAYANFRGKDWLAILAQKAGVVTAYGDVFSATPASKIVSKSAQHISFSDDGHYLAFYSPDGFGTYDTDKDLLATANLDLGSLSALTWFDPAHLLLTAKSRVVMADFDGTNQFDLISQATASAAYGTNDLRSIEVLAPLSATDPTPVVKNLDIRR